jgi:hypothetical protein
MIDAAFFVREKRGFYKLTGKFRSLAPRQGELSLREFPCRELFKKVRRAPSTEKLSCKSNDL